MAKIKLGLIKHGICARVSKITVIYYFVRYPDIWIFVLKQIYISNEIFSVLGCMSIGENGKIFPMDF